jgi:thioredoxin-like negative regulator of GroEL
MNSGVFRLCFFLVALATVVCAVKEVQVLTDDNIEASLLKGSWLVSFYAPWCHHCKKLEPVLDSVASAAADFNDIFIGKLDATIHQKAAENFHVDR